MVAKVSDFGISKLLTAETLIAHTKTLGTIGYMAPGKCYYQVHLKILNDVNYFH
uniref:Serine-threonine protein kinase, plant-type n=2 Tax=Solanum tuberosum TaxID=4113 RepID=M1BZN3_SOLTU